MLISHFVKWHSPIYINTLNILRPFKTLWNARKILSTWPKLNVKYGCLNNNIAPIYSEYYYDGYFGEKNKILHVLIEDVMWKTKFGLIEYEEPPRWHIVLFNKIYCTLSLNFKDNYREYERILRFLNKYNN